MDETGAPLPSVSDVPDPLRPLPISVFTSILEELVAISNAGQVMRLGLASKALLARVAAAEGFWERLSIGLGWSKRAAAPRTFGGTGLPPCATDVRWCRYYCQRMACRRQVRRFFKLYAPFLNQASSLNLMPGATPQALDACERRLGVTLPWEVWELYRFRNGQAPGRGVTFAVDTRLLGLDELAVQVREDAALLQERLAAMGAATSRQAASDVPSPHHVMAGNSALPGSGSGNDAEAPAGLAGNAGADAAGGSQEGFGEIGSSSGSSSGSSGGSWLIPIAANDSSSRCFLVAASGQVFMSRGLSLSFYAPSVSAMLQKLLA